MKKTSLTRFGESDRALAEEQCAFERCSATSGDQHLLAVLQRRQNPAVCPALQAADGPDAHRHRLRTAEQPLAFQIGERERRRVNLLCSVEEHTPPDILGVAHVCGGREAKLRLRASRNTPLHVVQRADQRADVRRVGFGRRRDSSSPSPGCIVSFMDSLSSSGWKRRHFVSSA